MVAGDFFSKVVGGLMSTFIGTVPALTGVRHDNLKSILLFQKKMRSDGRVGAASKVAVDKAITEEMKRRLKKSEVLHQKLEQKV